MPEAKPTKPFASSVVLTLLLGVIGLLPAFPAPVSEWPTLDTRFGWWLYLISTLSTSIALLWASKRERAIADWDSEKIQAEARTRHEELIAGQTRLQETIDRLVALNDQVVSARAAVAQTGPVGAPLLKAIDSTGSLVASVYADRQRRLVAPVQGSLGPQGPKEPSVLPDVAGATELLKSIELSPPQTPEAVARAISKLNHYVLEAGTGEYIVAGGDIVMTHRDAKGRIIDQR